VSGGLLLAIAVALLATGPVRGDSANEQQQNPPAGTAAISGVVTDAVTGRPLPGVSVTVIVPNGIRTITPRPAVLTDARGRFVLDNLPAGDGFEVVTSRSGYQVGRYEGPRAASSDPWADGIRIKLTDGEWRRDVNVFMWRMGSIGGRVVDERGEPIVGTAVRLYRRRLLGGRSQFLPGAVVTTDDRGIYRIPFLPPDSYYVAVLSVQSTVPANIPDGQRRLPLGGVFGRGSGAPAVPRPESSGVSVDVDGSHRLVLSNFATPPPPASGRPRAYAPTFYPSTRLIDGAQPIELAGGTSRTDIDFRLEPVPAVRISGKLSGATDRTTNMLLRLMLRGGEHLGFGSEVATTLVEADGRFTFLNVPAGGYTLVASPSIAEVQGPGTPQGALSRSAGMGVVRGLSAGYSAVGMNVMWWLADAGGGSWGRVAVDVGDASLDNLDVPMRAAATVSGRVVIDDPAPPDPSMRLMVSLEPANADPTLGVPNGWTDAGDPDRGFVMNGVLGGRYLFRPPPFGGWRLKSATAGGVDVTDAGIDGSTGQLFNDVVVTITRSGAELSGMVVDQTGGAATAGVVLFPTDAKRWSDYGFTPDRVRSTLASSDGSFKFTLMADGEYVCIAVPVRQADRWMDPRFLAAAATQGARVSLKMGVSASLRLQVAEVVLK